MSVHTESSIPWIESLANAVTHEGCAVVVVVAGVQGSAPREAGTTMVVSASSCAGSIGGGHLEFEATRIAREALAGPTSGTWIVRFPLAARLGQCCGGVATLAFSKIQSTARGWVDVALACARTGAPFAIVSSIAKHAAHVIITADDVRGSLGGSELDSKAIALARSRLAGANAGAALVRTASETDATLLIRIQRPDPFPVLIFGNGHVGRALASVLAVLPAHVRWIDSRTRDFPSVVASNVCVVVSDSPEDELRDAPGGAFIVVTTHSHALDYALIETAVTRSDLRYVGLIGSKAKRAQFERRLAARGALVDAFARVHCPIGATGVAIKSKDPGAIAVAIAAEMLVVREAAARSSALHLASS